MALTLCVFAVAYGAPTSLAAHVRMPHAAMTSECAGAGEPIARKTASPHAGSLSACCIAHCLPAAPVSLPIAVEQRIVGGEERVRRVERGEGHPVPVPLRPPRSDERA